VKSVAVDGDVGGGVEMHHRIVALPGGGVTPQKIGIPTGPSAAGTYCVDLPYGPGWQAYSATFTVG
jgi:hypothetical protein